MPPSNTVTANSSSSSTPAPAPPSQKRRRLSRTAAAATRPAGSRSSSEDELAVDARPKRRVSAAAGKKQLLEPGRRRSWDDDTAGGGGIRGGSGGSRVGEDGVGPDAGEESADELADEVHHFWRGPQGTTAAARVRDSGRKARVKAYAERGAKSRAAKASEDLVECQGGQGEDEGDEALSMARDGEGGREREVRSRSESEDSSRHGDVGMGDAPEGEPAEEQPAVGETAQPQDLDMEWEKGHERERAVENRSARKAVFRPYEETMVLRGHRRGVAAVKFSPDGSRVASCCKCFLLFRTSTRRPSRFYVLLDFDVYND